MFNKRYCPELGDKHDPQGKAMAIEIMRDMLGAEIVCENTSEADKTFKLGFWDQQFQLPNGDKWLIEPEIKDCKWFGEHWARKTGHPFRYDTMDIPFRKYKNQARLHMVISSDEDFAFLVWRKTIDNHAIVITKPTKYERQGEYFFRTSLDRGTFLQKTEGHWHKWAE